MLTTNWQRPDVRFLCIAPVVHLDGSDPRDSRYGSKLTVDGLRRGSQTRIAGASVERFRC